MTTEATAADIAAATENLTVTAEVRRHEVETNTTPKARKVLSNDQRTKVMWSVAVLVNGEDMMGYGVIDCLIDESGMLDERTFSTKKAAEAALAGFDGEAIVAALASATPWHYVVEDLWQEGLLPCGCADCHEYLPAGRIVSVYPNCR